MVAPGSAFVATVLAVLCGCRTSDAPLTLACVPGASASCACTTGAFGAQKCSESGLAYGECNCTGGAVDAGGTPEDGGGVSVDVGLLDVATVEIDAGAASDAAAVAETNDTAGPVDTTAAADTSDAAPQDELPCALESEGLFLKYGYGWYTSLALRDGVLFAADDTRVEIMDVADAPKLKGLSTIELAFVRMTTTKGLLLGIEEVGALRIIDVSQPASPVLSGSLDVAAEASLSADGATLLVEDDYSVAVIDLSDPMTPKQVAKVGTAGFIDDVSVSGGLAATVSSQVNGPSLVTVLDVSDPPSSSAVALVELPWSPRILVRGPMAYASGTVLTVLDLTVPEAPVIRGTLSPYGGTCRDSWSSASGGVLLGCSGSVVDVSNPDAPAMVGSIQSYSKSSVADGKHYFAAKEEHGQLEVFDLSSSPFMLAEATPAPYSLSDASLQGASAWIIDCLKDGGKCSQHLWVYDMKPPAEPVLLAHGPVPYSRIAVDAGYVYAIGESKLSVLDATDLSAKTVLGTTAPLDTYLGTPYVASSVAYVPNVSSGGVSIVDVSDPANPSLVGVLGSDLGQVAGTGDLLVHAGAGFGLRTYSLATPLAPKHVGTFMGLGSYTYVDSFAVGQGVALFGSLFTGVLGKVGGYSTLLLDVTKTPILEVLAELPGFYGATIFGSRAAFVGGDPSTNDMLSVYDLSNPVSPVKLASSLPAAQFDPRNIVVVGDYLYAGSYYPFRIRTYHLQCPDP